jgi:ABC-type multidrug transport system fused ATPase/permease subunit
MKIIDAENSDLQTGLIALLSLSKKGFKLLTTSGQRTIIGYSIALSLIGLLDVTALGVLAQAFSTTSKSTITVTNAFIVAIIVVVFLFILRSFLAVLISYLCLKSMAKEEVFVGQTRFGELMTDDWINARTLTLSDVFLKVDRASTSLIQDFLFLNATIVAEIFNAIIIIVLLIVVSPVTAVVTGAYFGLISIAQHFLLSKSSSRAGTIVANEFNNVYEILSESFHFGKLQRIMQSPSLKVSLFESRKRLAQSRASSAFLSAVPRYFMEGVLAFGCLLIFGAAYFSDGSSAVIPALAIFAGAGFRLLPIVNKVQGLILALFSSYPLAKSSLTKANHSHRPAVANLASPNDLSEDTLLELRDVSFSFPDSAVPVLTDINLEFKSGLQYAITGESGSGKTTLTEIILGLLPPDSGHRIVSINPLLKFGYVPQETPIMSGSIEQNIAMTWNPLEIDHDLVSSIIQASHLEEFAKSFASRTNDGELRTLLLSGGQRQRLGIARALYRQSNLLILDEPTSALDSGLEQLFVDLLQGLKLTTTTITVAHRLTTIQSADVIIYLENGRISASGTFHELSETSKGFRKMIDNSLLPNRNHSYE